MKNDNCLVSFYSVFKKDELFVKFYNEVTKKCLIHNPIMNITENGYDIFKYLIGIPNLFENMGLTNLLASYYNFINDSSKFKIKWNSSAFYVLIKTIISLTDFYTDSKEEFNKRCIPIMLKINSKRAITAVEIWSILDMDSIIDLLLETIIPFTELSCQCCKPFYNYEIMNLKSIYSKKRLDLVEKIICETDLNDYFCFKKICAKINETDLNKIPHIPRIKIRSLNKQVRCKIFDHFQLFYYKYYDSHISDECNDKCFIYNKNFISEEGPVFMNKNENFNITYVEVPPYCFVCGKYDIIVDCTLEKNKYICYETKKAVKDFACNICKEKISKILNIECVKENSGQKHHDDFSEEEPIKNFTPISRKYIDSDVESLEETELSPKSPCMIYFEQRRLKPLMMIMSKIFDYESLFACLPMEIINTIIFSIYWEPINALVDNPEEYYDRNNIILYSQYRSIIGGF